MEEKVNVWTARRRTALNLCSVCLASLVDLDESFQHLICTPRSEGGYLPTGKDFLVQYGYNDSQFSKTSHLGMGDHDGVGEDLKCMSLSADICIFIP